MPISQKGSGLIIAVFVGGLLLTLGLGFFIFSPKKPFPKTEPQKIPLKQNIIPSSSTKSEVQNPQGQDSIIKADKNNEKGPWNQSLYISVSNDGASFRDQKVFQDAAGVVSVIHDKKGNLYAVFQYFPSDDPQNFDKVAVKTSKDAGETWSTPTPAKFINYPKSYSRPFDPTLVLNPDGRIRMFFTVNTATGPVNNSNSVGYYSAISDDGLNFQFEEGKRFSPEGISVVDSAAFYFNNKYYLESPALKQPGGATTYYQTTSNDGLTFNQPSIIPTQTGYEWTGNLVEINGKLRFYGGGSKGIFYSETSGDGNWSSPVLTNARGGDPSVVQALESKFIIIFTGPSSKQSQNPIPKP